MDVQCPCIFILWFSFQWTFCVDHEKDDTETKVRLPKIWTVTTRIAIVVELVGE